MSRSKSLTVRLTPLQLEMLEKLASDTQDRWSFRVRSCTKSRMVQSLIVDAFNASDFKISAAKPKQKRMPKKPRKNLN